MKSLDIVVLCKIFVLERESNIRWNYAGLAEQVCLSVGETHASVRRLRDSHLFDDHTRTVIPSAMLEFLIHGVRYAFPAEIGARGRGLATAYSAPVFQSEIACSQDDVYIWPYAKGEERGLSVSPLSESAPQASLKDRRLYDLLALLDAVRIGRAREREIALKKLEAIIGKRDQNGKL